MASGKHETAMASGKGLCPARLATRERADWGTVRICLAPAKTPRGFCLRHDPETKPARDARGRIVATKGDA